LKKGCSEIPKVHVSNILQTLPYKVHALIIMWHVEPWLDNYRKLNYTAVAK
jgi:hypothetical protein